jgi:quercetin dioxygenase-like cupin family protein
MHKARRAPSPVFAWAYNRPRSSCGRSGRRARSKGCGVRSVRGVLALTLSGGLLAGCGSPSSSSTATVDTSGNLPSAVGTTGKVVAEAKVTSFPARSLYLSFAEVPQAAQTTISPAHGAGFLYDVAGTHRVVTGAGPGMDLKPGDGTFLTADTVPTHINPGTSQNTWYFVGLRPADERSAVEPIPGARRVYESSDLPQFGAGTYIETLRLTTIARGGRTAAHMHGGLEAFVLLGGSATVRVAGRSPLSLRSGQGDAMQPGTPLQVFNNGDADAVLLVFLVTLEGVPFQTNLNTSP